MSSLICPRTISLISWAIYPFGNVSNSWTWWRIVIRMTWRNSWPTIRILPVVSWRLSSSPWMRTWRFMKPSRPFVRLRQRRKLSRPSSWSMLRPYSKGQSISAIFSPNPTNKNSVRFSILTLFRWRRRLTRKKFPWLLPSITCQLYRSLITRTGFWGLSPTTTSSTSSMKSTPKICTWWVG